MESLATRDGLVPATLALPQGPCASGPAHRAYFPPHHRHSNHQWNTEHQQKLLPQRHCEGVHPLKLSRAVHDLRPGLGINEHAFPKLRQCLFRLIKRFQKLLACYGFGTGGEKRSGLSGYRMGVFCSFG